MIEHSRVYGPDGHHFVPRARLLLVPGLRTSGLLAALPSEELKTLIALVTFLSPNGTMRPTVLEVADALHVPEARARECLRRLEAFLWQGEPVARRISGDTEPGFSIKSMERCVPSLALFAVREAEDEVSPPSQQSPTSGRMARASAVPVRAVERESIIRRSRERYARPRALVEREILERLGYASTGEAVGSKSDASPADAALICKLRAYGITAEQAQALVARYPHERIERQISWMGHRQARDSARFLVAAIERDFEAPVFVRLQEQREDELVPAGEANARTEISNAQGGVSDSSAGLPEAGELDGVQLDVPLPIPEGQKNQR